MQDLYIATYESYVSSLTLSIDFSKSLRICEPALPSTFFWPSFSRCVGVDHGVQWLTDDSWKESKALAPDWLGNLGTPPSLIAHQTNNYCDYILAAFVQRSYTWGFRVGWSIETPKLAGLCSNFFPGPQGLQRAITLIAQYAS